jgi:hypothetical protein
VQPSYVCEQVHYAPAPQLHDPLLHRAPPSRDDAQPDDDDELQRDDERRLCDDAPAPDASVILPSQSSSLFVIRDRTISCSPVLRQIKSVQALLDRHRTVAIHLAIHWQHSVHGR